MPSIQISTNVSISKEGKTKIIKAVSAEASKILGKPEKYFVIHLLDDQALCIGGSDQPAAIIRLTMLGATERDQNSKHAALFTEFIGGEIGVKPEYIHMNFQSFPRENWAINGAVF